NMLTMVDVNPNWVVGDIDTGGEVFVVSVNPRSGHLFAVMGDRVQVYDRRDNELLTTIAVGAGAEEGIAVDAPRHLVYVTAGDSDEIAVIQDVPAYDLAYVTWLKNVGHVRLMEDGGEHGRILAGPDMAFVYPEWNPAGKHLAFAANSYTRNEYDIYRVEAGGQNYVNLTRDDTGTMDERPLWSPDGSQIAWIRDDALWVMDEYGYVKTQLTPADMIVHELDWSPDGAWIVIAARDVGETYDDIYLVPAVSGSLVQLTTDVADDSSPNYAPNGNAIVFDSSRNGNADIYLLDVSDLDNVQTLPLTTNPATDHSPVFSNDGSRIAFISYQDNCDGPCVFVMDADGSNPRNLSGDADFMTPLRWSPDDRWLATHTLGGAVSSQVLKINSSTGEIIWLTNDVSSNLWPTWRPDTWE
ncbi:MAG: PD40 domain-containing protein, partial [Anaerolineales bacterium]|nr:PD40 domain-containing protein [Anaerolineales bacterium]